MRNLYCRQGVGTTQSCALRRHFESRKWGSPSFARHFLSLDSNTRHTAFSGQEVSAYILYRSLCPSLGWEVAARSRRCRTGPPRARPTGLSILHTLLERARTPPQLVHEFNPVLLTPPILRRWRREFPNFRALILSPSTESSIVPRSIDVSRPCASLVVTFCACNPDPLKDLERRSV